MCKFIEQEALEKSNEIADAANEVHKQTLSSPPFRANRLWWCLYRSSTWRSFSCWKLKKQTCAKNSSANSRRQKFKRKCVKRLFTTHEIISAVVFVPSAYSKYVNESRLKVLAAQEDAVKETIRAARQHLIKTAKGGHYPELLQKLFVQVDPLHTWDRSTRVFLFHRA